MAKTKASRYQASLQVENIERLRPSWLEIDLNAFNYNFRKIKSIVASDVDVMAVVKANAYGHGLERIGLQAEKCGADLLGVAFIEEGEKLLEASVRIPIAVLYPDINERAERLVKAGLIATVSSVDYLQTLNNAAVSMGKIAGVFIVIETGMGRYGAAETEIQALANFASQMTGIKIIGIATNLADSNNGDDTFTRMQFEKFTKSIESAGMINTGNYHSIENSSGLLFHHNQKFNLVRIGLMLYGVSPKENKDFDIKPVMSLKSRIVQLKNWPAGNPIGYRGSFIPERDIVAATIGLGYADGYPWSLSNKSYVLVDGHRAPVIGKICMDAMMIDITGIPGVKPGDEVVLVGKCGDETITVDELAGLAGSFSYELLSGLSDRLSRIFKGG